MIETKQEIPDDLICGICKNLFTDAAMIPCCGSSFCDECVRTALLESEDNECPDCHEKGSSPGSLIPNRFLRNSVNMFRNETGYNRPRPVAPIKTASDESIKGGAEEKESPEKSDDGSSESETGKKDQNSAEEKAGEAESGSRRDGDESPMRSKNNGRKDAELDDRSMDSHVERDESDVDDNITVTVPPAHSLGINAYTDRQINGRYGGFRHDYDRPRNNYVHSSRTDDSKAQAAQEAKEGGGGGGDDNRGTSSETRRRQSRDENAERMESNKGHRQQQQQQPDQMHHEPPERYHHHGGQGNAAYDQHQQQRNYENSMNSNSSHYNNNNMGQMSGGVGVSGHPNQYPSQHHRPPQYEQQNMMGSGGHYMGRGGYNNNNNRFQGHMNYPMRTPRHAPPLANSAISSIYQGVAAKVGTGIIDDPLEAFNRIMREKERRKEERRRSPSDQRNRRSRSIEMNRRRSMERRHLSPRRSPDLRNRLRAGERRRRSSSYSSSRSR